MDRNWEEREETNNHKNLSDSAKEYLSLQFQLFKLNLAEKISQTLSLLIIIMSGTILLLASFVYLSIILVIQIGNYTGSFSTGLLIISSLFLLLFFLLFLFRKRLILNPIIRKMSKILFSGSGGRKENYDEE